MRCGLAPVFSFIILETAQAIAHIILNPKCELSFPPLPPFKRPSLALENTSRSVHLHVMPTDTYTDITGCIIFPRGVKILFIGFPNKKLC